jgi:hypothetical protein
MRKYLLLTIVLGPVAALAGLVVPVAAQSVGEPAVSQSADDLLNLDAIPVKAVNGPLAVQGVSDDEGMDDVEGHDHGRGHDDENESEDD